MALLRLRYVHDWVDKKTGRVYFRFRYRGRQWPLPGVPGSTEFHTRYDELRREHVVARATSNVAFGPNTLGSVIEKYLGSEGFTSKRHNTKRQYRRILDRLKEIAGRGLIVDLCEHHVRDIRKHFLPATFAADESVMLLSMLWVFAKEHLAMRLGPNPTTDVQKLHKQSWTHEPWPEAVIEKFEAEARPKPNAALALLLLLYTGQRAGDVAAMKWGRYDGEGIQVRQQKTDKLLWIACHSKLKHALDHAERKSEFILTTQNGSGYSAGSFCNMIAEATAQIGAKEYTAHGLRKNAAIALAEAGCPVPEIMAITGHKTYRMALHYTSQAEQKKLSRQAIERWEVANPRTSRVRASG